MTSVVKGQSFPQFSQNVFSYLTVNPGYAGNTGEINSFLGQRNQWLGFEGAPATTVFGVDKEVNLFGSESGIGISGFNDQIGEFKTFSASFNYAKRWDVGVGKLGMGLSIDFMNQALNGGNLYTMPLKEDGSAISAGSNDTHTDETFNEDSGMALGVGLGVFLDTKDYYIGVSMKNLTNPQPKFTDTYEMQLKRTIFVSGGYRYKVIDRPLVLVPSAFFKSDFGSWELDLALKGFVKDKYWGGLGYRYQDAITVLGGIELNTGLRIGVSYDLGISEVSGASGGTFDVMLGYIFNLDLEKRKKLYKSVRYL